MFRRRGVRRAIAVLRRGDRPLADPARRSGGVRRDPAANGDLPDREPCPDAEPLRTRPETSTTSHAGRSSTRPSGRGGAPYIEQAAAAGGSVVRLAGLPRVAAEPLRRRSASSSSRTGARRGDALAGFSVARRGAAPGDEPQAQPSGARIPRARFLEGARSQRRRREDRRSSTTSWSASPASASPSPTPPLSPCSHISRMAASSVIRPSSSPRC